MSIEMNSLSSGLMLGITLYRNQPGHANKVIAGAGYAVTAVVASAEIIVALASSTLSFMAYPLSPLPLEFSAKWLASSVFTVGWATVDIALTPWMARMVADEKSARLIAETGNFFMIPRNAVV